MALQLVGAAAQGGTGGLHWAAGDGVITRTFFAPAVTMTPGEMQMTTVSGLDWVHEPAAVVNFESDLVDEAGASIPLSEAYMHHWLMHSDGTAGFGAGSEFRGVGGGVLATVVFRTRASV